MKLSHLMPYLVNSLESLEARLRFSLKTNI